MSINAIKPALPFSLWLLSVITLLIPLQLLGAEQAAPVTPPAVPQAEQTIPQTPIPAVPPAEQTIPQTPIPDHFDVMEAPRNYVSVQIASLASSIDRFFGNDRHYQESNQTVAQLDLNKLVGYGSDHKIDFSARVNLRLPATEGRLHLLLETDPENNINAEPTPGSTALKNTVVVPKSVALAARYGTGENGVWSFNNDIGIKFPIPPKPFVRSRGSYSLPLGSEWRLKAAQSVYWFNTLGAGETSQFDLERIISVQLLFRASSTVTWLNDRQNFDMHQDFSFYSTLSDRTAVLYQASVVGVSNPAYAVTDLVALVLYRYRMHKEWLFFELSPQLHFPKDREYRLSPALNMRLEMLFDDSR